MADVVRNGAIFRVKNPAVMRSPIPLLFPGTPKLPRGRIAVATPETPGGATDAKRSSLERVVSLGMPRQPQQPQQRQTNKIRDETSHQLPHGLSTTARKRRSVRKRKKPSKNKTTALQGNSKDADAQKGKREDDERRSGSGGLLSDFDRIVSESMARKAPPVMKASDDRKGHRTSIPATTTRNERTAQGASDAAQTAPTQRHQPPKKGYKRQRVEPEEEAEPSEEEEEEESDNEQDDTASDDMVMTTPQRKESTSASEESASEDNEDGVRVQKRLFYDDTPPSKAAVKKQQQHMEAEVVATSKSKRQKKSSTTTTSWPSQSVCAPVGSGLEQLSKSVVVATTPSRSTRIQTGVLTLSEWYIEWPPPFIADELQLVFHGHVLGQPAVFTIQRRVTVSRFVSTDNENVRLDGCIDIERAQQADVPPKVMELLVDGIPTNWRHKMEAYAPPPDPMVLLLKTPAKTPRKTPAKAAKQTTSIAIPAVTAKVAKPTKKEENASSSDPLTPGVEKRSRSGRRLTPVLEWWRNERKVTTASFETTILEGSPSFLPSKRDASGDEDSPATSSAAQAARQKIQLIWDAQKKSSEWSDAQVTALNDAKVLVPTTDPNFWAQVASHVPGKTADECRTRGYEELTLASARKPTRTAVSARAGPAAGAGASAAAQPQLQVPIKVHRVGSNLFKKQVRQFVHDLEQKNVDDLFSQDTPSKAALAGASGLDDLKSPGAPTVESDRHGDGGGGGDDDSDDDVGGSRRELSEKVSMHKRDEVDSYVRTLKRGNDTLGLKAVRTRQTTASSSSSLFSTPPASKKPRRTAVEMTTEVGGRKIEAIVTPNGTTRVRIEKNSEDEDDDEGGSEEREEEEEREAELSDGY